MEGAGTHANIPRDVRSGPRQAAFAKLKEEGPGTHANIPRDVRSLLRKAAFA